MIAAALSLGQELAGNACVAFSMIADLERAARHHGNRGYRYVHFEAGAIGSGPAGVSFEIGQILFLVTSNVASDGVDIRSGLFGGPDGIFDNLGGDLGSTAMFNTAAVNIPEPATGLLVALGLLGLRLAAPAPASRASGGGR